MPVTIAMSSELLFNQEMRPGPAFYFVRSKELFKLILINPKSPHKLNEAIKTKELSELIIDFLESGEDLVAKLQENKTHLYLSAEPGFKVQEAVNEGIAAAVMFPQKLSEVKESEKCKLRIVFDGDAVLFSDESERVTKTGLQNFFNHEREKVNEPMREGPFKGFLEALRNMQRSLSVKGGPTECTISTYLVTARGAGSPGYRALNTLKTWGLETNQAYFLSGDPKGPLLEMISPHIFFDDQMKHVEGAQERGILACHVPYC
ncbi:hypothetical protein Q5P01_020453 [Channa striata]|uniref:Cytosolic 5'-nucleotidase 1A n=1 Tax=Channa striata TaxID=64152 RepID=A0AA88S3G8_CHASR|nr:hypothetical protein Q5P01_020453 [Channa striata]